MFRRENEAELFLQIGTGEYTTGWVGTGGSNSDKKVGVVGLTLFDLRRRGKVGNLSMVGTSGTKFPAIRTTTPPLCTCFCAYPGSIYVTPS